MLPRLPLVVVIIRASGVRWSMPSRRLRRGRRREACPEDPFPRRLSCTHMWQNAILINRVAFP